MAKKKQTDVDDWARIHEALAHAFRLTILEILREEKRMSMADLRRAVAARYKDIETRNLQFHTYKMHMGGVVRIDREEGRDYVTLLKDVTTEIKAA